MAEASVGRTWINQVSKTQLPDITLPLKYCRIHYLDCVMIQPDSIPQRVTNYLFVVSIGHEGTPLILTNIPLDKGDPEDFYNFFLACAVTRAISSAAPSGALPSKLTAIITENPAINPGIIS